MWTLGYDDNGGEFSFSEPFDGARKLRPLVPRPMPSLRVNGSNFCAQYYHLASLLNEQSKREMNDTPPVVVSSSRWNPTPEQLRILEELYRRGTRTPSADQIQHITSQLRRYGKIEGKNVFYWFQNHKARERQKRRRQTAAESATDETKHSEAAGREKGYEIQQTKTNCRWPPSKNCSTAPSEGPKSCIPSFLSGLAAAAAASASAAAATPWLKIFGECVKTQRMAKVGLEEGEGEGKRNSVEGDATWNTVNRQLLNPRRKTTTGRPGSSCDPTKTRHLNGFVEPYREKTNGVVEDDNGREESQTLQLFPLRSTKFCKYDKEGRQELEMSDLDMIKSSTFSPSSTFQFFEFLPLKN